MRQEEVPVTYPPRAAPSLAAAILILQACDTRTPTAPGSPTSGIDAPVALDNQGFRPPFDASSFVAQITNPYLPGIPGTAFHYRSETPEGVEINVVKYTRQTKQILGVTVTVIRDQVFLDGELTEDTFDWEAQDTEGNVWYFGEDTKELENGQVVSTQGSWEAGVNGAKAGIIMLAHPKTGLTYIQEDAPDVAEDRGKALGLKAKVDVPYGSFDHCLQTLEWSLLELGVREHKFYCPGVGFVEEVSPKGGHVTNELVAITHF
jgi:hypothetical protein